MWHGAPGSGNAQLGVHLQPRASHALIELRGARRERPSACPGAPLLAGMAELAAAGAGGGPGEGCVCVGGGAGHLHGARGVGRCCYCGWVGWSWGTRLCVAGIRGCCCRRHGCMRLSRPVLLAAVARAGCLHVLPCAAPDGRPAAVSSKRGGYVMRGSDAERRELTVAAGRRCGDPHHHQGGHPERQARAQARLIVRSCMPGPQPAAVHPRRLLYCFHFKPPLAARTQWVFLLHCTELRPWSFVHQIKLLLADAK